MISCDNVVWVYLLDVLLYICKVDLNNFQNYSKNAKGPKLTHPLNPKKKTTEEQRVGACSLARSTLRVEGCAGAPRWDWKKWQATNHSHKPAQNQTTSWLMHSWSTLGARTSHEQTRTHKIHHGPNLKEATTFPFIVYFVLLHEAHIQMAFCLRTPKWESRNSQSWDSCKFGAP